MSEVIPIRKRFTLQDYHRLGELGFFREDERLELIKGELLQMVAKGTRHSVCNTLLVQELILLLGKKAVIRGQEPIILPADSEPQPDVAIVQNPPARYLSSHPYPQDVFLVVEIADSSLKYDQETKLKLYAEASINDYWIVNLIDNYLEVYQQPYRDIKSQFNYKFKRVYLPDERVNIPRFPDLSLDLSLIF